MRVDLLLDHPYFTDTELESLLVGVVEGDVEVVVVDPGMMRVLNRTYRHIDRPTDVLTFDLSEDPAGPPEGVIYVDGRLGPPITEVLERVIHGWLHLCGETHDTEEDAGSMQTSVSETVARCMTRTVSK
jgi:probable rRNA maturation factor